MILLPNLRLMPGEPEDTLKDKAAAVLGIEARDILGIDIVRKSLDARKKQDIHLNLRCMFRLSATRQYCLKEYRLPKKFPSNPNFRQNRLTVMTARPGGYRVGPAGMLPRCFGHGKCKAHCFGTRVRCPNTDVCRYKFLEQRIVGCRMQCAVR
jgi:uncharacterized FAD-dependent dehydrogenase